MCLEPVAESLVVADRVSFLQESGVNVKVVKIIDSNLSPRCLAFIASKSWCTFFSSFYIKHNRNFYITFNPQSDDHILSSASTFWVKNSQSAVRRRHIIYSIWCIKLFWKVYKYWLVNISYTTLLKCLVKPEVKRPWRLKGRKNILFSNHQKRESSSWKQCNTDELKSLYNYSLLWLIS